MTPAKLPIVTARQLVTVLEQLGFQHRPAHSGTSHQRYIHPDGRRTSVPIHKGKDISRGLLRKILRDIDLSPEELVKLL